MSLTKRHVFWYAVAASFGWHARSVLAWYCERSGETPNLPSFKIDLGRLNP